MKNILFFWIPKFFTKFKYLPKSLGIPERRAKLNSPVQNFDLLKIFLLFNVWTLEVSIFQFIVWTKILTHLFSYIFFLFTYFTQSMFSRYISSKASCINNLSKVFIYKENIYIIDSNFKEISKYSNFVIYTYIYKFLNLL